MEKDLISNKIEELFILKKRSFIKGHNFAKFYEKNLKKIKNKKINVLEIGAWKGASTASFFYYFPNANFISIDRNFKFIFSTNFFSTSVLKNFSESAANIKANSSLILFLNSSSVAIFPSP